MTREDELQKYMILLEQYKEQLNQLELQSQYLQAAFLEYSRAKVTLENLSKTKKGIETLIPIGGGVFIYASINDLSKIIIDVGSNVAIEKNIEDTIKKIENRLEDLKKNQEKINSMMEQIQAEAENVSIKAQEILSEEKSN